MAWLSSESPSGASQRYRGSCRRGSGSHHHQRRCRRAASPPPSRHLRPRLAAARTSRARTVPRPTCGRHSHSEDYSPPGSSIVVDGNSGVGARSGEPRRAAPSGLADQGDDALSAVRAARFRQDAARYAAESLRSTPPIRIRPSSISSPARPSPSKTPSRASSPARPMTPPSPSPKISAATKTASPR